MLACLAKGSHVVQSNRHCATLKTPKRAPVPHIPALHSGLAVFNFQASSLRALHLMVALHSLRISGRHIRARARRLSGRRRRRPNKAVLLTRKLRARRIAVHGAVALLAGTLAAGRILRLALHVVVCDVSLLCVADLLVGGVWRDCDDVPGVEEAGEEAEHCACC